MSLDNERLDGGSLGVSPADSGTHGLSIGTSLISFNLDTSYASVIANLESQSNRFY